MKLYKFIFLLLMICYLAISSFAQKERVTSWTCPQMVGNVLNRQVCDPNFEWEKTEIVSALMISFYSTKTPAGFSQIFEKSGADKQIFDLTPNTLLLSDVLTKIVTGEPQYQWKEENGVINVFPSRDYEILDTKIPLFKFDNQTIDELLADLQNTKQFENYLKENNLTTFPLTFCCGLQSPKPPRRFSIDLKDSTVREILNEIVRLNGSSTWLYREYESTFSNKIVKRYYDLHFLVQTY